ncbi:MAG: 4-hydroxythreonine-4-phosphate dehydrogenase PdxA [Candidatus Bathyarchaeia archaeon]
MSINKPRIGLFIGDATGIGPEIMVKVIAQRKVLSNCFIIGIGDHRVFSKGQRIAQIELEYPVYDDIDEVDSSKGNFVFLDLKNLDPKKLILGQISPISGKIVGDSLKLMVQLALSKRIDAVVYAPLNKEALYRGGYPFKGEIGFFAHLMKVKDGYGEMNVLGELWTSRVTSHISIADVSKNITQKKVLAAITQADSTLKRAHIEYPKIGVSALNPHGGEGGLFGREEQKTIVPAVQEAKRLGINVVGPYSADTIFLRISTEKLNAIVTMYHDQGQIAMKLMGFSEGVTVNAGLPIIITTPSHGTAFDIAGKGVANPNALKEAILLATKMASWQSRA